jgi:hypothetical protein
MGRRGGSPVRIGRQVRRQLARVTELEFCEHVPEDFAFWIAAGPGILFCEFC